MRAFLDLPAELRLQIYGYIAVPYTRPFSSYIGLYLSYSQVQAEMNDECGSVLLAHLLDIQSQLLASRIDIPATFLEMQHIRLFHGEDTKAEEQKLISLDLEQVERHHYVSITFTFSGLIADLPPQVRRNLVFMCLWIELLDKKSDDARVEQYYIDMPEFGLAARCVRQDITRPLGVFKQRLVSPMGHQRRRVTDRIREKVPGSLCQAIRRDRSSRY